jgi:hypothetical protein
VTLEVENLFLINHQDPSHFSKKTRMPSGQQTFSLIPRVGMLTQEQVSTCPTTDLFWQFAANSTRQAYHKRSREEKRGTSRYWNWKHLHKKQSVWRMAWWNFMPFYLYPISASTCFQKKQLQNSHQRSRVTASFEKQIIKLISTTERSSTLAQNLEETLQNAFFKPEFECCICSEHKTPSRLGTNVLVTLVFQR